MNRENLFPSPEAYPAKRLFCLDLLRGIDMFLLVAFHGVLVTGGRLFGAGEDWFYHLSHPAWEGFAFWDMIMPLFMFMCGAAIPLAIGRRLAAGESKVKIWKHVILRVALLWFCGMLVQGNLATLEAMKISPYNNTLQTIASGYLIAVLVVHVPSKWFHAGMAAFLALLYTVLLHFCGDYTTTGNFANVCEMKILNCLVPVGSKAFVTHNYTWFLTTIMFGAISLCGVLATEILIQKGPEPKRKAINLFAYGLGLVLLGFVAQIWVPCIKHIFTFSFSAQAMGYCVLALAVLYVLTDIFKFRRGTGFLLLYGQYALTAYMAVDFFGGAIHSFVASLTQGLPHLLPQQQHLVAFLTKIVFACVVTTVLVIRRRLSHDENRS